MKQIVVPIDKEAETRLDYSQNITGDLIEYFISDKESNAMFKTEIYDEINHELDLLIDDFEDEQVTGKENLQRLYAIILKHENTSDNPVLHTLKSLTEAAIRFDTGVYFFF